MTGTDSDSNDGRTSSRRRLETA